MLQHLIHLVPHARVVLQMCHGDRLLLVLCGLHRLFQRCMYHADEVPCQGRPGSPTWAVLRSPTHWEPTSHLLHIHGGHPDTQGHFSTLWEPTPEPCRFVVINLSIPRILWLNLSAVQIKLCQEVLPRKHYVLIFKPLCARQNLDVCDPQPFLTFKDCSQLFTERAACCSHSTLFTISSEQSAWSLTGSAPSPHVPNTGPTSSTPLLISERASFCFLYSTLFIATIFFPKFCILLV